jgi:hypothetical protein
VTLLGGASQRNSEQLWNLFQSAFESQFDTGEEAATFSWKSHDGTGASQINFRATVRSLNSSTFTSSEYAKLRIFALYLVSHLETKQLLNVCKYAADEFAWQLNANPLPMPKQSSTKRKASAVRQVSRPTVTIED